MGDCWGEDRSINKLRLSVHSNAAANMLVFESLKCVLHLLHLLGHSAVTNSTVICYYSNKLSMISMLVRV